MRCALALVLVHVAVAHAQPVNARDLYLENPAEAAAIFETRFRTGGSANDGISAVVASRAAGRYAHARALLVEVTPKVKPGGQLDAQAQELEAKLAHLTVAIGLAGDRVDRAAIVKVDGQLPERMGEQILVDIGEHTLTVEQTLCDPFSWQGLALPGDVVQIPVRLLCQRQGTLHLTLVTKAADAKRSIWVDGKPFSTSAATLELGELDVPLDPGAHVLVIENHGRVVTDETVAITPNQTVTRRFTYPWRAQQLKLGVRAATVVAGNRGMSLVGFGAGAGMDGSIAILFLDLGPGESLGHVGLWAGFEVGPHVFHHPLWQTRRTGAIVTLDFDPLVGRADLQKFSVGAGLDRSTWFLSFAPVRLTAEWAPVQLQLTVWPLTYVDSAINLAGSEMTQTGFGFAGSLSLAWHN